MKSYTSYFFGTQLTERHNEDDQKENILISLWKIHKFEKDELRETIDDQKLLLTVERNGTLNNRICFQIGGQLFPKLSTTSKYYIFVIFVTRSQMWSKKSSIVNKSINSNDKPTKGVVEGQPFMCVCVGVGGVGGGVVVFRLFVLHV